MFLLCSVVSASPSVTALDTDGRSVCFSSIRHLAFVLEGLELSFKLNFRLHRYRHEQPEASSLTSRTCPTEVEHARRDHANDVWQHRNDKQHGGNSRHFSCAIRNAPGRAWLAAGGKHRSRIEHASMVQHSGHAGRRRLQAVHISRISRLGVSTFCLV